MTRILRLFIISMVAVITPGIALAQTVTYTLSSVPQADDDDLAKVITAKNEQVCTKYNAVGGFSCTQAQACTAAVLAGVSVTNGASCTAANAKAAGVRIWPNTSVSDRNEYVRDAIASPAFADQRPFINRWSQIRACITWQTQNQTQRDAACAAHNQSAGCSLYPTTCPGQ